MLGLPLAHAAEPEGNPVLRTLVAALRAAALPHPSDPDPLLSIEFVPRAPERAARLAAVQEQLVRYGPAATDALLPLLVN